MSDNFYVVLPSNEDSQYAKINTPSHYITRLNQPIELDGEWEVGLSEISYEYARKDVEAVNLYFDIYTFYAIPGPFNPVYNNAIVYDPYMFSESNLNMRNNTFVKISKSTEGIHSLSTKFNSKYPQYKNKIKFQYGKSWMKIETVPFEYPENSQTWHFIVPKFNDPGWNEMFYINTSRYRDWRFYISNQTDRFILQKNLSTQDHDEYGERKIISLDNSNQYTFIFDNDEFEPAVQNSSSSETNASDHIKIHNSAIGLGAIYIDGLLNNIFKHASNNSQGDHEYFDPPPLQFPVVQFDPSVDVPIYDFNTVSNRFSFAKRRNWNPNDASDMFFIYTDICESSHISIQQASVLRVVAYDSYLYNPNHHYTEFDPVFYKKVTKSRIDDITIWIADTIGQLVKFNSRIQITLHFRKIKTK